MIRSRIEQSLGAFPLSPEQVQIVATRIAENFIVRAGHLVSDSSFFDFHSKVTTVIKRFEADGLSLASYVNAGVIHPTLFYLSPERVIANIEGVREHFGPHGLTLAEYLRAAVRKPSLFYQSPSTITANVESVARHFDQHMNVRLYLLRRARAAPTLLPGGDHRHRQHRGRDKAFRSGRSDVGGLRSCRTHETIPVRARPVHDHRQHRVRCAALRLPGREPWPVPTGCTQATPTILPEACDRHR